LDVKKVVDAFLASEIAAEQGESESKKRFLCELLLNEFSNSTPDELLNSLQDACVMKKGPAFVVTFSFPVMFNPPS
jgi:hypothetical protein